MFVETFFGPPLELQGLEMYNHLGGGFKYFYFQPYLGKWSNLTNIFQRGWNHQLVILEIFIYIFVEKNQVFQLVIGYTDVFSFLQLQ